MLFLVRCTKGVTPYGRGSTTLFTVGEPVVEKRVRINKVTEDQMLTFSFGVVIENDNVE